MPGGGRALRALQGVTGARCDAPSPWCDGRFRAARRAGPPVGRDRRRKRLDLEHHAGERLADVVVELASDPPLFGLLQHERAARAVAALELEPFEQLVKASASAATSGSPATRARVPGASGSCRCIVSASSSSGRNAGRSKARLTARSPSRPAPRTASSLAAPGTETLTGATSSPPNASASTTALVRDTRQTAPAGRQTVALPRDLPRRPSGRRSCGDEGPEGHDGAVPKPRVRRPTPDVGAVASAHAVSSTP